MNKKIVFIASALMLFAATDNTWAAPPTGGSNYQTIDAATAQAYMNNYKNNVQNKFAEYYTLDLTPITNYVNAGAAAVRMYNGLMADGSKVAVMVPVDVNYNNITNGSQMAAMSTVWICPPNCDVTKSGATATMMSTSNAQAATNNYNNNGNYDSYNAFLIYPAVLNALRNVGTTYYHVCNGIITGTGQRCIIYRGVNASGGATYYIEDSGSMSSRASM
ncbi:MAG: hypothetical protein BGO69_17730 [Bacteroidetes bacterium 46-16]|nr:MAG: hypothetical protein BGO69_17730 [Bacteroidetes bacterium 46-16]